MTPYYGGEKVFLYKDIAKEWDRLNALTEEEALRLGETIEDGVNVAIDQFCFQLEDRLFNEAYELNNIPEEEKFKILKAIGSAIFSGYLIFISYQNLMGIKRRPRMGIQYNPTLMNEYNETIIPQSQNQKNEAFVRLLDEEPAIEMLIDRVGTIEMNILRKAMPAIEKVSFSTGDLVRSVIMSAVLIGFGIAFAENNLKEEGSF